MLHAHHLLTFGVLYTNNQTFGDGTLPDAIRNFTGWFLVNYTNTAAGGVFYGAGVGAFHGMNGQEGYNHTMFDPSRVVPTAAENRVRTSAINFWRLVFKD